MVTSSESVTTFEVSVVVLVSAVTVDFLDGVVSKTLVIFEVGTGEIVEAARAFAVVKVSILVSFVLLAPVVEEAGLAVGVPPCCSEVVLVVELRETKGAADSKVETVPLIWWQS